MPVFTDAFDEACLALGRYTCNVSLSRAASA
jgi:hypothetical protein